MNIVLYVLVYKLSKSETRLLGTGSHHVDSKSVSSKRLNAV